MTLIHIPLDLILIACLSDADGFFFCFHWFSFLSIAKRESKLSYAVNHRIVYDI